MASSVLLDTSVVISHLRRNRDVTTKLLAATELYLPIVALGELYHGACALPFRERQLEKIDSFLGAVTILGLTQATAQRFGAISAALRAAGTPIPTNDIWIGALAVEHGFPLAAQDSHFDRIPDLTLFQW